MNVKDEVVVQLSWSKRVRAMFAAGVVSATLAAAGDFFSSKGGWLVPLIAGALATAVFVGLAVLGNRTARRMTEGDELALGWWDGPVRHQLGMWVIASFAVCSLVLGLWSRDERAQGGVMGANIDAVADQQVEIGLLRRVAVDTGRSAESLEQIGRTLESERTDTPEEMLAKRGIPLKPESLADAAIRGSVTDIELLVDAGVMLDGFGLNRILTEPGDDAVFDRLHEQGARGDPSACVAGTSRLDSHPAINARQQAVLMWTLYFSERDDPDYSGLDVDPTRMQRWVAICGSPESRAQIDARLVALRDHESAVGEVAFLEKVRDSF